MPRPISDGTDLALDGAWLERLALQLTGDGERARELAQETRLAALEQGPSHSGHLRGWFAAVARHLLWKAQRGSRRRRDREQVYAALRAHAGDDGADESQRELALDLAEALRELAPEVRAAVELRFLEGLTLREVSARLGVPLSTVDERIRRGLSGLRKRLGPERVLVVPWMCAAPSRPRAVEPPASCSAPALGPALAPALAAASFALVLALGSALLAVAAPRVAAPLVSRAAPTAVAADDPSGSSSGSSAVRVAAASAAAAIEATGRLAVDVRAPSGAPLGGVWVHPRAALESAPHTAALDARATDAAGRVEWDHVAPGRYDVHADRFVAPGVSVSAGRTSQVSRVLRGPDFDGLVVDERGRPIEGAVVWLSASPAGALFRGEWLDEPARPWPSAISDADGRFRLLGCGEAFRIGAGASGRAPRVGTRLAVGGDPSTHLTLTLDQPGGALEGRVLGPAGQRLAGATVALLTDEGCAELAVATDARGGFRFGSVAAGRCRVVVDAPAYAPWVGELEIAPGRTAVLDCHVSRTLALGAVVREHCGAPLREGFVVARFIRAPGVWRAGRVDGHGRITLDGVTEPEAWRFALERGDRERASLSASTVAHGFVALQLVERRVVEGAVVDERGRGLAGLELLAQGDGAELLAHTRTDDSGWFQVEVPAQGATWLTAREAGFVVARSASVDGLAPVTLEVLDAARPTASICGSTAESAAPLATGMLLVLDHDSGTRDLVPVDVDGGRFCAGPVPPGRYAVSFLADEVCSANLREVELAPHGTVDVGALEWHPRVPVRVSVTAPADAAPLHAQLRDARGVVVAAATSEPLVALLTLRQRLPPGDYVITAWASGAEPAREPVRVAAGPVDVEVSLTAAPACRLVLVRGAGVEGGRRPLDAAPGSWGTLEVAIAQGERRHQFELAPSLRLPERSYVLELGLDPGTYAVSVDAPGAPDAVRARLRSESATVTITEAAPREVILDLAGNPVCARD